METKWASLIPFAKVAELLREVLPVDEANHETVRQHLQATAQRMEEELGEERQLPLSTHLDQNRNFTVIAIRRELFCAVVMAPKFALVFAPLAKPKVSCEFGLPGLKWLTTLNASALSSKLLCSAIRNSLDIPISMLWKPGP